MAETLILGWEKHRVTGLVGEVSGGRLVVSRSFAWPWPEGVSPLKDPARAGKALREQLNFQGVTNNAARVCLPREEAVIRQLQLPPQIPDEELPDLVKLQAATKSSVPVDQLRIDFLPLPIEPGSDERGVMLCTITRNLFEAIRKTLSEAGLELDGIGLSTIGVSELALQLREPAAGEVLAVVNLAPPRLEISFLRDGHLQMMHAALLGGDSADGGAVLAELNRAQIAAEQRLGSSPMAGVVVFCGRREADGLGKLRERFGAALTVAELFESSAVELRGAKAPESSTGFAGPAGLLWHHAAGRLAGIDFLHPRKKPEARDTRMMRIAAYAAGGLLLLAGVGYGYWSYLRGLDRQYDDLLSQSATLAETVKAGEPTMNANEQLTEWTDRDFHLLSELDNFQQTLPGTDVAYLESFRFDVATGNRLAKYTAKGQARSLQAVQDTEQEFTALGWKVTPQEIKTSRRDTDYPSVLSLDMERAPQPKTSPQTAATPGNAAAQ